MLLLAGYIFSAARTTRFSKDWIIFETAWEMPKTGKKRLRKQGNLQGRKRADIEQEVTASKGQSAKEHMIRKMHSPRQAIPVLIGHDPTWTKPGSCRNFLQQSHICVTKPTRQGPKGGVPGALEPWNFCCGARSPIILLTGALILFWLWRPEPKEILRGARSPAFSSLIIRVPKLHRFLITAFLCMFVRVDGHK